MLDVVFGAGSIDSPWHNPPDTSERCCRKQLIPRRGVAQKGAVRSYLKLSMVRPGRRHANIPCRSQPPDPAAGSSPYPVRKVLKRSPASSSTRYQSHIVGPPSEIDGLQRRAGRSSRTTRPFCQYQDYARPTRAGPAPAHPPHPRAAARLHAGLTQRPAPAPTAASRRRPQRRRAGVERAHCRG